MMTLSQGHGRAGTRGEGKIGAIIGLLILILVVHVLLKYVPARISNAELADFVEEKAREYTARDISYDQLIGAIVKYADEQDMAIDEDDIQVEEETKSATVRIEYDNVLNMWWGEWTLHMTVEEEAVKF
jgi:hypothetical protein